MVTRTENSEIQHPPVPQNRTAVLTDFSSADKVNITEQELYCT